MPADQPRGPNRAWKNQAASPGAASSGKRAWQKRPDLPAGPRRPWSKKSKLGLATFAVSGILLLMIAVILYLRPAKPACLVLVGDGFEEELAVPHNVYGWKGLVDLAALGKTSSQESWLPWQVSRTLRVESGPRTQDLKQPWVPTRVGENTVMVFLALHGGSDLKNGAYLVVTEPGRGPRRVPVRDILKDFASPELKGKKKVLLLDATQVPADWPSGMLHNDFVRKLKELEPEIARIDDLVVLCSSDMDQRSWVSEEWQQTIFAHYVIEGLRGAADSDFNSRVTALELFNYVKERVKDWTQVNRGAVQEPILLPSQAGADRARGIELVQNPEPYQESGPDKAPGKSFQPPPDLLAAWQQCTDLGSQVPSPAVYTPQLWRRYQDTLLRYEELVRAGDPTGKASQLRGTLGSLKDRIVEARPLQKAADSVANTLQMPAALGRTGAWKTEELQEQFKTFWNAPADKRQEAWTKLKEWALGSGGAGNDAMGRKLLQVELSRLLLAQAVRPAVTRQDIDKARDLLDVAEKGLANPNPRPTEAHYLIMLLRDLDANPKEQPDAAILRQALEVNALAERIAAGMPDGGVDRGPWTVDRAAGHGARPHPYSESVMPWIKDTMAKADERRRHGQDLLCGPRSDWDKARADFTVATSLYQQAGKDTAVVREALALRDQLLGELSYYARWLALQRPAGMSEFDSLPVRELMTNVEGLAAGLNMLAEALKGSGNRSKDLRTMQNFTADLSSKFTTLKETFALDSNRLSETLEHQLRFLPRFQAALAVPLIEPERRMRILRKSRELSAKYNDEFRPDVAARSGDRAPMSFGGDPLKEVLDSAERQGRMAVAVTMLSDPWLDAVSTAPLRSQVSNLQPGQKWYDDIARAGDAIGDRHRLMRQTIEQGLKASVEEKEIAKAAAKIQAPEYLCRLIAGGQVSLEPADPFDAVQAGRRLRFHDLLLWQTRRTLEDHWFSESLGATKTYYELAARGYVKDAEALAEAGSDEDRNKARQKESFTLDRSITRTALHAVGPASQYVTERDFRVGWDLKADPGMPAGVPVFWLELPLGKVKAVKKTDLTRGAQDPLPPRMAFALQKPENLKSTDGDAREAPATLHGIFRGQRLDQTTVLNLLLEPEIHVIKVPPPNEAGVSLRLEPGFTYGAVCLVLDCTGSMWDLVNGQRKFDLARTAMRKALESIPEGTYLSFAIYGHRNHLNNKPAGRADSAEEDATTVFWLRQPSRWDPRGPLGIANLMRAVNNLVPQNHTPLAEAIAVAREQGFPPAKDYNGPRVILTLTDGEDNLFTFAGWKGRQELWNPTPWAPVNRIQQWYQNSKSIGEFLDKAFRNSGIELQVVIFTQDQAEAQRASQQFNVVKALDPPGQFLIRTDSFGLEKTLLEAIRPRLRLFKGSEPARRFPEEGLLGTGDRENPNWQSVAPDYYAGRVQNVYRQDINLARGQLLEITLKNQGKNAIFTRGLLADVADRVNKRRNRGAWHVAYTPWHVSLPQNEFVRATDGRLRQLVAIEREQQVFANAQELGQVEPRFVWMELKARGQGRPFEWHNEFGFSAPTFRVNSMNWPTSAEAEPAAPELDVWWCDGFPEDSQVFVHSAGNSLNSLLGSKTIGGNHVAISSVKADSDRYVTIAFDGNKGQATKRSCLVVEIDHDPGKPVWVRAEGLEQQGEEHLCYIAKGKYTAVFWGVSGAEDRTFQLTVVSVDDFKKSAPANRHAVLRPTAPEPGDVLEPQLPLHGAGVKTEAR
jgi:hypothetical protein